MPRNLYHKFAQLPMFIIGTAIAVNLFASCSCNASKPINTNGNLKISADKTLLQDKGNKQERLTKVHLQLDRTEEMDVFANPGPFTMEVKLEAEGAKGTSSVSYTAYDEAGKVKEETLQEGDTKVESLPYFFNVGKEENIGFGEIHTTSFKFNPGKTAAGLKLTLQLQKNGSPVGEPCVIQWKHGTFFILEVDNADLDGNGVVKRNATTGKFTFNIKVKKQKEDKKQALVAADLNNYAIVVSSLQGTGSIKGGKKQPIVATNTNMTITQQPAAGGEEAYVRLTLEAKRTSEETTLKLVLVGADGEDTTEPIEVRIPALPRAKIELVGIDPNDPKLVGLNNLGVRVRLTAIEKLWEEDLNEIKFSYDIASYNPATAKPILSGLEAKVDEFNIFDLFADKKDSTFNAKGMSLRSLFDTKNLNKNTAIEASFVIEPSGADQVTFSNLRLVGSPSEHEPGHFIPSVTWNET